MSWFSRLRNALTPATARRVARRRNPGPSGAARRGVSRGGHYPGRGAAARAGGVRQRHPGARAEPGDPIVVGAREHDSGCAICLADAAPDARRSRITAVLSLSLAIGANTAIYAIVDAAMLRPLPVPEPQRVFTLAAPTLDAGATSGAGETESFSYPLYLQLRAAAGDSARLAVFGPTDRAEVQGADPRRPLQTVRQQFVSGEAFEMLRVPPAVGRLFSRDDDRDPGIPRIAVLSFDFWRRHFNADPGVVGQRSPSTTGHTRSSASPPRNSPASNRGSSSTSGLPVMTFDPGVFSNPTANLFRIVGRLDRRCQPRAARGAAAAGVPRSPEGHRSRRIRRCRPRC